MKSALREIRHIQAIPALASPDRGQWDEFVPGFKSTRIAEDRERRWRLAHRDAEASVRPDLAPYLLARQHDAFVVSAERQRSRFALTALDEDLGVIIEWTLGLDRRRDGIPFEVVFEGVTYVGWRSEERDGSLRSVPEIRDFTYTEWGTDTLIDPELPGVRWAVVLRHQRYEDGHFHGWDDVLLLIKAASIHIVEPRREEWIRRFGEAEVDLFDRYQAIRADVSLSGPPDRYAHLGIDREDLRSTLPRLGA